MPALFSGQLFSSFCPWQRLLLGLAHGLLPTAPQLLSLAQMLQTKYLVNAFYLGVNGRINTMNAVLSEGYIPCWK